MTTRYRCAGVDLRMGARFKAKGEPAIIDLMGMIISVKKHATHHHHHR